MADSEISMLPETDGVTDDTLIPVYQPGATEAAQRMNGKQFAEFAVRQVQEDLDELSEKVSQLSEEIGDLVPVDEEQISQAVNDWLDEHPEATTTVADGSITKEKLHPDMAKQLSGLITVIDLDKYGITQADYTPPLTAEMYEVAYKNGVGLQNAINDALANRQTELVIPPGNYPLCYHANAKDEHNPIINSCGISLVGHGVKLYVIYDEDGVNPYYKWTDAEIEENGGSQNSWVLMGTVMYTDSGVEGFEIVGERAYRKHENTKFRDGSCGIRIGTWSDGNIIRNCKIHHISGDGIGSGLSFEGVYISGDIECTPGTVVNGEVISDSGGGLLSPRMKIAANVDMARPIIMCSTGYRYFLWTSKTPTIHCFDENEVYIGSVKNNQGEPWIAPAGTVYVYVELYMGSPDATSYTANFRFGNATYRNTSIENCESYLNQRGGMSNLPTGATVKNCRIHDNGGAYGEMVAYYDGTQFGIDIEDWYIDAITIEGCTFFGQLSDILFRCNKIRVKNCILHDSMKSLNYAVDVWLENSKFHGSVILQDSAQFGEKFAINCTADYGFPAEIKTVGAAIASANLDTDNTNLLLFKDSNGAVVFSVDLSFLGKTLGDTVVSDALLFDLDLTKATAENLTISDETGNLSATISSADAVAENGVCVPVAYSNTVSCTWNKVPEFNREFAVEMFCFGFPKHAIFNGSYKTLICHQNSAGLTLPTSETTTSSVFANIKSEVPYLNTTGETVYGGSGKTNGLITLDDGSEVYGNEVNVSGINTTKYFHIVFNFDSSGAITIYCNGYPAKHTITTNDFATWDLSTFSESFAMFRGAQNGNQILKSVRLYNKCLTKAEVRNNLAFEAVKLGY